MASVRIELGDETIDFELHPTEERGRWTAPREIPESYFPLVVELSGRRFELYSDGTFSEEELRNPPPPDARVE